MKAGPRPCIFMTTPAFNEGGDGKLRVQTLEVRRGTSSASDRLGQGAAVAIPLWERYARFENLCKHVQTCFFPVIQESKYEDIYRDNCATRFTR